MRLLGERDAARRVAGCNRQSAVLPGADIDHTMIGGQVDIDMRVIGVGLRQDQPCQFVRWA